MLPVVKGWAARLRRPFGTTFGPASEEPYRRRLNDVVRLVAASAIVVWCVVRPAGVSTLERTVFQAFNSSSEELHSLFLAVYRLGGAWVNVLVVAPAVIGRRWRLTRDFALPAGTCGDTVSEESAARPG